LEKGIGSPETVSFLTNKGSPPRSLDVWNPVGSKLPDAPSVIPPSGVSTMAREGFASTNARELLTRRPNASIVFMCHPFREIHSNRQYHYGNVNTFGQEMRQWTPCPYL
jgi:hypothetical protein